ncbi:MAG: hypothetical protein V1659_05845 [Candidatus Woesearchaeota archaeon]
MPTTKTTHTCNICGAAYDTEEEAKKCEKREPLILQNNEMFIRTSTNAPKTGRLMAAFACIEDLVGEAVEAKTHAVEYNASYVGFGTKTKKSGQVVKKQIEVEIVSGARIRVYPEGIAGSIGMGVTGTYKMMSPEEERSIIRQLLFSKYP